MAVGISTFFMESHFSTHVRGRFAMPHAERRQRYFLDCVDGVPTGGFRLARDGSPYLLHSRCPRELLV